ncbi:hypothetical protein [Elizabethkingia ursingii]|uniref:hypothetical protein n=1 Tax=Elizabethkingia ursingii TaxID=1756150 RepID=UPI0007510E7A|nr:hypothetical protein [Elizabethkingia ursingii]KUY29905.1 hypothetical protein ATB96_17675 [Elizabethkingia ursingii]
MSLPNDKLSYTLEEYRGYIIASKKSNTLERNPNNLNIVFKIDDFPLHGYFVGYDDSKLHGPRKMHPNNLEDARCFVDWIIEVRAKALQNSEVLKDLKDNPVEDPNKKKEHEENKPKIHKSTPPGKNKKKGRGL